MASELYKNHLIISRSHYDPSSCSWVPEVMISWALAGQDHWHVVKKKLSFETENEAIDWGLKEARIWVDQKM
jgi:hypothetical protein